MGAKLDVLSSLQVGQVKTIRDENVVVLTDKIIMIDNIETKTKVHIKDTIYFENPLVANQ